jgi:serine/threonine-protein kinase
MSPEQAMGERSIDARSDIYALGAVLYEMLTGDPPFTGSTVQAIVAKVLTGRPTPPRAVRDTVPPHVESTILKALAKLPADRFATAQEFVSALAGAHSFQGVAVDARTGRSSNATRAPMLTGILAVIAVAGIATSAWLATRPTPTADGRLMRVDIRLPDSVTVYRGPSGKLAFSHDGSMLVVAGVKGTTIGLYLRRMNDPVAQLIRGSESGNSGAGPNPVFSGDGASILFTAADGQMVIPVAGGTARRIIDSATAGHWIDDNTVLFARRNGVWLGSATSRATRLVGRPDTTHGVFAVRWPHLLPGGTHALVTLSKSPILGEIDSLYLAVLSLADGKITELGMPGTAVRYLATGHIMFGRAGGELYVAPFSLSRRAITGPAVKVVDNVWQGSAGATDFAVSDDGRLAYTSGGGSEGTRELLVLDPTGAARRVPAISNNPMYPRISPNGRVVASGADGGFDGGVWIADLASGAVARVAANGEGFRPEWMRDGSRILYIRSRRGVREIVSHAWDGNGDDRVLARDSVYGIADVVPGAAHGYAVFVARNDLYVAPMDSLSAMRPLAVTPNASEGSPAVSPDGQFVAYVSNESATREVYVQQLPGPGRRVRVSVNGGIEPRWDPSGNGLYYRTASRLMHATLGPLLDVVRRDSLFVDAMDRSVGTQRQNWDVMPNGREFIMVQLRSTNTVSLVVNWRRLTEGKK